ncbi:MAG: hypothetical protein WDO24_03960 [Pseudomonadota bacterium]
MTSSSTRTLGKYADYCTTNLPWYNPKSEMAKRVAAAFKKQFPNDPFEAHAFNVGFTYEAMLIAAQAGRRRRSAGPAGGAAPDQHRRAYDDRRPDRLRREGPEQPDRLGCIQNRNRQPRSCCPRRRPCSSPCFPMPGWNQRS